MDNPYLNNTLSGLLQLRKSNDFILGAYMKHVNDIQDNRKLIEEAIKIKEEKEELRKIKKQINK